MSAANLPESDIIILYDIPSTVPGVAWSPNTWKTRFALNYKGLAYRTEWVEYPDIAPLLRSLNVVPNPPPAPHPYALPVIYDPRTRSIVADSAKIAAHLDATYPDTPPLLPHDVRAFHVAFQYALSTTVHTKLGPLIMHQVMTILNPRSAAYFRTTREQRFGCKMEELSPPGEKREEQWASFERACSLLASWFEAAGDGSLLLMGGGEEEKRICHADISVASLLVWIKVAFGPESEEWRRVEGFDGGRWKRFMSIFDKWADTTR